MDKHTQISSMSSVDRLIEMQEFKDRMIAAWIMKDCCTGENLKMWRRPLKDPIDMSGECMFMGTKYEFNLEIKGRKKDDIILRKFPYAELRQDKYERMRESTRWGVNLLYMQLLNEKTCYIFNLDTINWKKVETYNWNIKKTQMDENSEKKVYPIYNIPLELAFLTLDCSKYYEEYNKRYIDRA